MPKTLKQTKVKTEEYRGRGRQRVEIFDPENLFSEYQWSANQNKKHTHNWIIKNVELLSQYLIHR